MKLIPVNFKEEIYLLNPDHVVAIECGATRYTSTVHTVSGLVISINNESLEQLTEEMCK